MSQLNDDELKKLVESNARAIEALANTMAENERKSEEERVRAREERVRAREEMAEFREIVADAIQNLSHSVAHLDNSLARVAISQGELASNTYRIINKMENRQGEIVDVIKLLTEKVTDNKKNNSDIE